MKFASRLFFLLFLFLGLVRCSSKFKPEQIAEISKNEEYEEAIRVQTLAPPVETTTIGTPVPPVLAEKNAADEKKEKKKNNKKNKKETKVEPIQEAQFVDVVVDELLMRRDKLDPFKAGQTAVMNVSFSGVSAGLVELKVRPFLEVNGEKSYYFTTHARTNSLFSFFYEVDDWAETYMRYRDLAPLSLSLHVRESKQVREVRNIFDWDKKSARYWEKKIRNGEKKVKSSSWSIPDKVQNVISAFFYLRLFHYEVGKNIEFLVADDGKNISVVMEVVRKEKIVTEAGEFDAFLTKIKFEYNGVFKQVGDVLAWIIDDPYHHIGKVEAKLSLGTISLSLKEIINADQKIEKKEEVPKDQ